jgi:bacteriocin resistance YdeI/OmpD-like protein/uncharacterized protein DUF1905
MKFPATVQLHGKSATGIEIPPEVVAELGSGKRPKVLVRLNDYSYRSSIGSMGGKFLLPVSAEVRAGAGVTAGDEVEVELTVDSEPRSVTVPEDLAAALDRQPATRRAFDSLSYSDRRRHVLAVEDAKTSQTRQRRITKIVDDLR